MDWSARQYLKFEDERTRPVRDLLAAVPATEVRLAADLGCGPGNSTEVLAAAFPEASITGLDSSPAMIEAARRRLPQFRFELGSIAAWENAGPWDVMLANAALQWVPDHATLLPRLVAKLAAGGSLAVQMPNNLDEPAHRLMREVAADTRWAARLTAAAAERTTLGSPEWYYRCLRPHCARVDVWQTTYHHPLAGADAVVEWFKGSGLQPFLRALDEADRGDYLTRYRDGVARACPPLRDGTVLLPFPRLFFVATR